MARDLREILCAKPPYASVLTHVGLGGRIRNNLAGLFEMFKEPAMGILIVGRSWLANRALEI
jgi:hypothetical protein